MTTVNHECYVSLEVAKLLREAGFDWECREYYYNFTTTGWSLSFDDNFVNWNSWGEQYISAPTLDVAQRWLREIRHRSIEVKSFVDGTVDNRGKWWIWHMYDFNPPIDWVLLMSSDCRYSTYEEAQEASIKKALEIILEKGE
jgi:hypothetical protein